MNIFQGISDLVTLRYRYYHLKGIRLQQFHLENLKSLINYALEKSPFYQNLYQNRDIKDFQSLPTVNKKILMDHFSDWITVAASRDALTDFALKNEREGDFNQYFDGRFTVGMSSGTSGNKALILTDRALTSRLPFIFLGRSGIPSSLLPYRIIFLLRVFNRAFQDINAPFIHLKYVNTMTAIDQIIESINTLNANVLMGPPSMLRLLVRHRDRITAGIKIIVSYAEVLEDHEKTALENNFQVPVIQFYQASEGPIGSSCRKGNLHINEDLVYVELLDENNREVTRPGIPCRKMLVSNFYNLLQPMIRYELNDVIELGGPCTCGSGFRRIGRIIGRNDDVFYFRTAGGNLSHVFPDLISRWIISVTDQIIEYQLEQSEPDRLIIRMILENQADTALIRDSVENNIRLQLDRFGMSVGEIVFPDEGPIFGTGQLKFKRFIRKFEPFKGL